MASETGATKDQWQAVYDVAKYYANTITFSDDQDGAHEFAQDMTEGIVSSLIPPGALLLDPEAVAALRTVLEMCDEFEDMQAFGDIASERKMLRAALKGPR